MKYGPFICIGFVLLILFVIWVFSGSEQHEFVGITPLLPTKIPGYTGTFVDEFVDTTSGISEFVCLETNTEPCPEAVEEISVSPPQLVCVNEELVKPKTKRGFVSKGEKMCCETMEKLYGVPFINTRPEWLRNPETGEKLELDCYNEEFKLAVEYNGEQHYNWPNFTNQSQEQFINQVRRDSFKMDMCDRNGIYLIVVPYTVKHKDIATYLISSLPETMQKKINKEQILTNFFI